MQTKSGTVGSLETCEDWVEKDKKYVLANAQLQEKLGRARAAVTATKQQLEAPGVRDPETTEALLFRLHQEEDDVAVLERKLEQLSHRREKNRDRITTLFQRIAEVGSEPPFSFIYVFVLPSVVCVCVCVFGGKGREPTSVHQHVFWVKR